MLQTKQILTLLSNEQNQLRIKVSNNNLIIIRNKEKIDQIPINKISLIQIIGGISMTSCLLESLAKENVCLFICSYNFLPVANFLGCQNDLNFDLTRRQFLIHSKHNLRMNVAKDIVHGKIIAQLSLLTSQNLIKIDNLSDRLSQLIVSINRAQNITQLFGIEGSVASFYYQNLFYKHDWTSRKPRAKHDIANFLLDIGYNYLYNQIQTLLIEAGFELRCGFLHVPMYQRKSLACDLMESFRPLIDHCLYKAFNLNQIKTEDFVLYQGKIKIVEYPKLAQYINLFVVQIVANTSEMKKHIDNFKFKILDYDLN